MRRLRAARYAIRRGLAKAASTPVLSVAVACAIAASLVAVGIVRLASHNLEANARHASTGPGLIVYLEPGVEHARALAIASVLADLEGTDAAHVVSPEQAKARLELTLAGDPSTLADLDASFFPETIEVGLKPGIRDVAALHPFVERLEHIEGVETVDVLGPSVDRAARLVGSIRSAAAALSVFLTACAIVVVLVLVRSSAADLAAERTLYARLGAGTAFAIAPEVVVAMIRGFAGGALAVIVLYVFYALIGPQATDALEASVTGMHLEFLPALEVALLPLGGAAIAAIGVALADRGVSRA